MKRHLGETIIRFELCFVTEYGLNLTRGFKSLHWVAFLNIRKEKSIQFKEISKNRKSKTSTAKLDLRPSAGLSKKLPIGPSEVTGQDAYIFSVFITRRP